MLRRFDGRDVRGRRAAPEPLDESVELIRIPARDDFDTAVGEIACATRYPELAGACLGAGAIEDALYPPADPVLPADHAVHSVPGPDAS